MLPFAEILLLGLKNLMKYQKLFFKKLNYANASCHRATGWLAHVICWGIYNKRCTQTVYL